MNNLFTHYNLLRIAACSPKISLADTNANLQNHIEQIEEGLLHDVSFFVFPELSITGYSCGDLFYDNLLLNSSINTILDLQKYSQIKKVTLIVGSPLRHRGKLYNCAILISSGVIVGVVPKSYLCSTNEYYESRWFHSGIGVVEDFIEIGGSIVPFGIDLIFEANGFEKLKIAIEICEDLWVSQSPSTLSALAGATLICNLSASNELINKKEFRSELVKIQSAKTISSYVYAASSVWESSSDLIFSGHSIIAENGRIVSEADRFNFEGEIIIADIDLEKIEFERTKSYSYRISDENFEFQKINFDFVNSASRDLISPVSQYPFIPHDESTFEEILKLQSFALARRMRHVGSDNIVLGLSGGLDSALAYLIAVEAVKLNGNDLSSITAVSMPGYGTSHLTQSISKELAQSIGTKFVEISIISSLENHFQDISHFEKNDITFENAQARERTQILMSLANKQNALVLGTGDLSEIALGWNTYNGDHISMYGVNCGVPKTLVQNFVLWFANKKYIGNVSHLLKKIIEIPISPELLENTNDEFVQKTEDIIGPYKLHDFIMFYFIRYGFSPEKILFLAKNAFENEFSVSKIKDTMLIFFKRFFANQFKRAAMPDGPKIGTVGLSQRADWRMTSDVSSKVWLESISNLSNY